MTFERFEKPGERFSKKISVWKQGVIHISKGTINSFALTGLDYCTLHYDSDLKRIGLHFISTSDIPGSVKLSYRDVGAVIPAKSFFDYYQINYNPSRQYMLEQDPESGLLVIDLGAPLEEGYAEHPDGRNAQQACTALKNFIDTHKVDLPSEDAGILGRYLFEAGVYFNWSENDMSNVLEELWRLSRQGGILGKPRTPLEKRVFDQLSGLNPNN